jgi:hypothetical protein
MAAHRALVWFALDIAVEAAFVGYMVLKPF